MTSENEVYTETNKLRNFIESVTYDINTMMLVEVISFDPATQRVKVQPVIKAVIEDPGSTETIFDRLQNKVSVRHEALPVILDVPVQILNSGVFHITIPIIPGMTGMLIISQRDISVWKKDGGTVEQGQLNRFDINDGVFIPWVPNAQNAIENYNNDDMEIKFGEDGLVKLKEDGEIEITSKKVIVNTEEAEVNATTSALVKSPQVDLGDTGGQPVARVGDSVNPTTHLITSGSTIVKATG